MCYRTGFWPGRVSEPSRETPHHKVGSGQSLGVRFCGAENRTLLLLGLGASSVEFLLLFFLSFFCRDPACACFGQVPAPVASSER